MTCKTVQTKLNCFVAGDLTGDEQGQVAAHLRDCPACQAEAAALRRVEGALQALAIPETAPERLADLQHRLSGRPRQHATWRWLALPAAGVVAAALLLLVASQRPSVRITPRAVSPAPVQAVPPPVADAAHSTPTPSVHAQPAKPTNKQVAVARRPTDKKLHARKRAHPLVAGPVRPASNEAVYLIKVSLPDGSTSCLRQVTQDDAAGVAQVISLAYEKTDPQPLTTKQGG